MEHTAILGAPSPPSPRRNPASARRRAVLYGQSREVGEIVARACVERISCSSRTTCSSRCSSGLDGQRFTYCGSAPLFCRCSATISSATP
ncbi:MAG: hypothetical protein ACLTZF_12265 [Oscillospiraceae bacterium]